MAEEDAQPRIAPAPGPRSAKPSSPTPAASRIDHVGIVVNDLVQAEAFFGTLLGLREESRLERPNLRALFFACGDVRIEVIEVIDLAERAARLGDVRARIEHLALVVGDLERASDDLRRHGVEFTEIRSSQGRRTSWSLPATTNDVVYQLIEEGRGA